MTADSLLSSSSCHNRQAVVCEAMETESWKAISSISSMESSIWISSMESSIWISSMVKSIRITKRKSMSHWGYWSSSYNSNGLWFCDNMNWSSGLLSGKATGCSIVESSFERGLSSCYIFNVIQIGSSNLFSLYIIIYRCKASMLASDSSIKSSLKFSFGSSNFWSVFQRSSSSNGKNKYLEERL